MDSKIRVRFFRATPLVTTNPPLDQAFRAALAVGATVKQRERETFPGVVIRLERLREDAGFVDAEIVRVQTGNLPPEARDDGLVPLGVGGLGHSTVISYHSGLNVMAVQANHNMSVGRALDYLRKVNPTFGYRADPLVRQDAWERYNRGHPRKVVLTIASPQNLPAVEGEVGAVTEMSRRLAEMAEAPVITIEIGMGHNRIGSLRKAFVDRVLGVFMAGDAREHDIRKLEVVTTEGEGVGTQAVNFLDDVLTDETTLDLPDADTDAHFERRRAFLHACFAERMEYIANVYGPQA